MPKSKKPRKKSRAKSYYSPFALTSEDMDKMREVCLRFELIAEYKLHRGECDAVDMNILRDMLNVTCVGLVTRESRAEYAMAVHEDFRRAAQALSAVIRRGNDKKTGRYVCTADELNTLREVIELAGDHLRDSIDTCPRRFLREWKAMQWLKEHNVKGEYDPIKVKRLVERSPQ